MEDKTADDPGKYLNPTETIDSDNVKIIRLAENLTADCETERERAVRLFYFARDSIRYSLFMTSAFKEDFQASRVLDWGKGYCVQKAVLLCALGRAAGIPTRLGFAAIRNHRIPAHVLEKIGTDFFPRHGYNQFYLEGRWISAAATFDLAMCKKNNLPAVEFDGRADAELPEHDFEGRPYIEYVERFSVFEDLPFEWIRERIAARIGPDKRPVLNKPGREQSG
jgi:transglutaminase-like putative cysteine protease